MTFLRYGQICVPVALAILEKVACFLQICNSCFYQSGELWPVGLLFLFLEENIIMLWVLIRSAYQGTSNVNPDCMFSLRIRKCQFSGK